MKGAVCLSRAAVLYGRAASALSRAADRMARGAAGGLAAPEEVRAMSPLRRVEAARAGPGALGILAPPGRETVLIVRPRALPWDLLLLRGGEGGEAGTPFLHLAAEDAEAAAEGLWRALQKWSAGGPGRVEEAYAPDGAGYWVQAEVGPFPLIACPRRPGHPYRPAAFATPEDAATAARAIAAALCPPPGAEQEVYLNTRHFGR
jgi:hypothetical protein